MFKKTKLKNGLKVILSPLQETKAVTVLVLVKVGSRYETRKINGASHFVEHLMFKGTKKRPTALSITKELDGVGADYNAFTSKDHTGYYIKVNHEHMQLALDILSDMIFNSTFSDKEIERERGVIIEEINMYEDNPMMFLEDLFEETVYGGHPLGWNISGPKEVIRKVTRQDLFNYYKKHYRPYNILVSVAGRIDGKILSLVDKYFNVQKVAGQMEKYQSIKVRQQQPQIKLKNKKTEQVQLALGFPAYSYFDKQLYSLYLLSVILGGNMSSRLFTSIREQKGLCYFIRAGVSVYEDTGHLMIQAGLDKLRLKIAIKEILNELKKVRQDGVTADELHKAKEFLKGKFILDLEACDHVASWLAKQELLRKRILTPSQQIKKIESITQSGIKQAAREIIKTKKINLSLIGPFKNSADFRSILKI
ncbi:insulinase family protein [Patescibacteria group bacterium]|nr:insulinase family protein [Patescibacteria group bacterium]